jgi:hypothetical protein
VDLVYRTHAPLVPLSCRAVRPPRINSSDRASQRLDSRQRLSVRRFRLSRVASQSHWQQVLFFVVAAPVAGGDHLSRPYPVHAAGAVIWSSCNPRRPIFNRGPLHSDIVCYRSHWLRHCDDCRGCGALCFCWRDAQAQRQPSAGDTRAFAVQYRRDAGGSPLDFTHLFFGEFQLLWRFHRNAAIKTQLRMLRQDPGARCGRGAYLFV